MVKNLSEEIIIKGFPPTINHSHGFFRGRVYLKKEVLDFKSSFAIQVSSDKNKKIFNKTKKIIEEFKFLSLDISFFYPWLTVLKGKTKKIDLSNRIKIVEDCIGEAFNFDDSRIFLINAKKAYNKDRSGVVTFSLNGLSEKKALGLF